MLRLYKGDSRSQHDSVVREIAERSAAAKMLQLGLNAADMSVAELRGYVRAHAWSAISTEVRRFAPKQQLAKMEIDDLTSRALEQTVHFVTSAYVAAPVISMPTPHIGVRVAA